MKNGGMMAEELGLLVCKLSARTVDRIIREHSTREYSFHEGMCTADLMFDWSEFDQTSEYVIHLT